MASFLKLTSFAFATLLAFTSAAPVASQPTDFQLNYLSSRYIIELKPSADISQHLSWVNDVHKRDLEKRELLGRAPVAGIENNFEIKHFRAYAGEFDEETIDAIRASEDVLIVEHDAIVHTTEAQFPSRSFAHSGLVEQENAPLPLQILSQRFPITKNGSYFYDGSAGEGTFAYVLDTGINTAHVEFDGRASVGYSVVTDESTDDLNGHGTHCAGIIGSNTYGVAKKTSLIAVKVVDRTGSGSWAGVIDGYNWAISDIQKNTRIGKAVISMSLGGPYLEIVNNAVRAGFDAGVVTVVSAGNNNYDASRSSPASAPEAITVGATDQNYTKAYYSNFGPLVDVFSVGSNVLSTYMGNTTATARLSGTSMSCPHVAGLSVYLQALYGITDPQELRTKIVETAQKGVIRGLDNSTDNYFAYNDSGM